MRSSSVTMRAVEPVTVRHSSTTSPTETVRPVPSWIVAPGSRSATAARTKPSAVSVTKVKSRFGVRSPESQLVGPGEQLRRARSG